MSYTNLLWYFFWYSILLSQHIIQNSFTFLWLRIHCAKDVLINKRKPYFVTKTCIGLHCAMGEHEEGFNFLFNGNKNYYVSFIFLIRIFYIVLYSLRLLSCGIWSWFMHYFAIHIPCFGRIWSKIEIRPSLCIFV